jgi:hypothetical protein
MRVCRFRQRGTVDGERQTLELVVRNVLSVTTTKKPGGLAAQPGLLVSAERSERYVTSAAWIAGVTRSLPSWIRGRTDPVTRASGGRP